MSDVVDGRCIWEVANQLEGYVGPSTPEDLAQFLLREGKAAAALAAEIARLRAELAKVEGERDADQTDRMVKISALIANLTSVQERYGDTCVYIRRGGMSWGAVALNRQADDKKNGVFDLQAQHDRDMQRMAELVERWKADCKAAEDRALAAEAKIQEMGKALEALPTAIMALDWKARKDWTVEDQANRHGELQEMIAAALRSNGGRG